jgi:hypothetical protein
MTTMTFFNETPKPPEGIQGCILQGLVAPQSENDKFELWMAALTKLAEQQEREARERVTRTVHSSHAIGDASAEIKPPLPKLAAGPWRSLGGYFDYTHWADRDRFLELDKAIAANQEFRDGDELERDNEMI